MGKQILFILSKAFFSQPDPRAAQDLILACTTVEHKISVLFIDDGVWQLQPAPHELAKNILAWPSFEITDLYVDNLSLKKRGIAEQTLTLPAKIVTQLAIKSLLHQHDIIFRL